MGDRIGDLFQKAFYLGVGAVAAAGENIGELRTQAQKLADKLVEKGEMTTDEARKFVDDMLKQAQQPQVQQTQNNSQPRPIEIISDEEEANTADPVRDMRQQVEALQEELRRLKRDG